MTSVPGENDSQSPAGDCDQETFSEELRDNASPRRSQSLANGDFSIAGDTAGEEHIGDVGASHQQHENDDTHKDLKRRGEPEAQAGQATGRGGEVDAGVLEDGQVARRGIVAEILAADDLPEEEIGRSAGLRKGNAGFQPADEVKRPKFMVREPIPAGGDFLFHGKGNP